MIIAVDIPEIVSNKCSQHRQVQLNAALKIRCKVLEQIPTIGEVV